MNESQSVSIVLQRVCSLLKSVKKKTFVITQHTTHPNTCTAGFTNCHISLPNTKLKLLKTCKKTTTQAVKASSNATTNRYEQTRAKQKKREQNITHLSQWRSFCYLHIRTGARGKPRTCAFAFVVGAQLRSEC